MFKKKALMALNKKTQYATQLKTYMNHQMTLDSINMTTENIKNHHELVPHPLYTVQHPPENRQSTEESPLKSGPR
jgi:hypothetical protein